MTKNRLKKIVILILLTLTLLTTFVKAENEIPVENITEALNPVVTSENTVIPEGVKTENEPQQPQEPVLTESDVYLAEDNITIDYMIDGNLYVFADTVTIDSQIGGDAFICANNVKITPNGYVFGNLFNISNNLVVDGTVYDIYSISKEVTISGFVYRDIKISSDILNIFGTIRRNAFVNTNSLNFSKTVEIKEEDNGTEVPSTGVINGNITYSAPNELSISNENVLGEKNYTKLSVQTNNIQTYLISLGTFLATVVIIWLLCLYLTPKFLDKTKSLLSKNILPILGFGVLGLITLPIISIILILLNITSTIAILVLALYFILIAISTSIFTISITNIIAEKLKVNKNIGRLGILIITAIVFWAICLIPYLGTFIAFVAIVLGLGSIFYNTFKKEKSLKKDTTKS